MYYTTTGTNSLISNNTADAGALGGIMAAFAAIWGLILFLCIAVEVVQIIAKWKMFTKAGQQGWKAIIPVYNMIVQCQIVGVNPLWVAIAFGPLLLCWIPVIGVIFYIFAIVAMTYFEILLAVSTTNAFGKDTNKTGWALYYFVAPFVCDLILGFGKSKFVKKDPMKDIIFKK